MSQKITEIKAILVDDEAFANSNLSNLISAYCPALKIIDSASNVPEAAQKINHLKPDVIFLDVNMPGQNGFELLDQLTHTPSVIFVTAHEKHALRAMKVCAVDFLLKPIDIDELIKAETKLLKIHAIKPEIRKNYRQILHNLSALMNEPGSIRKITLYNCGEYEIFDMDDILYLNGEDNYTVFHFLKHKNVMITKTLREYEEILVPYGFMRIHKSTLVNLSYINKVITKDGMAALMMDGHILQVSRRKATHLLEWVRNR